jgi:acetyltransferase-like isoleucine patch superfamily enzyme
MISALADIQSTNIGEGTHVWQFCVVLPGAVIGKNCNINCHVFIENDVVIGDNVTIKPGVQVWDGLRIGDKVFIGPNVTFTNDLSPRSQRHPLVFTGTVLEEGVSIGANSTILAGIVVSRYAMIGAGSVVTKNVPPYTLWYGNPAIHKGYVTKGGTVISLNLKDKEGKKYKLVNEKPIAV